MTSELETHWTGISPLLSIQSEILNGKRELNIRQIRALADRFHVSPSVFI